MTRLIRLLALLLLLGGQAVRAEDFVHAPTGVKLPEEILGFVRGEVTDFEKDNPGQGMSIGYRRPGEHSATLTIYTGSLYPFPISLDDPAIAEIRKSTVDVILARAKNREPRDIAANSRHTQSSQFIVAEAGNTPVLIDMFIVYIGGLATNDMLFLWLAKDHLWKLRVTKERGAKESPVAFTKALVQLSTAESLREARVVPSGSVFGQPFEGGGGIFVKDAIVAVTKSESSEEGQFAIGNDDGSSQPHFAELFVKSPLHPGDGVVGRLHFQSIVQNLPQAAVPGT